MKSPARIALLVALGLLAPRASPADASGSAVRNTEIARRAIDPLGRAALPAGVTGLSEDKAPLPASVQADGDGTWRDFVPPARRSASAVFDSARDRMLMFGGIDQSLHNETWSFDGALASWSQLLPGGRTPTPRALSALAYDAGRDRIWMFGGYSGNGALSGLWTLDFANAEAGDWTLLQPLGTWPDARGAGALVIDPVRDRLVLFGGQISPGIVGSGATGDVWALSPAADTLRWTRLQPAGQAPAARWGAIVVFDAPRDRMVVLGGRDRDSVFTDAWELRFSPSLAWAPLTTFGARPPARDGALGVLDVAGGRIVTVGGNTPSTGLANRDTWTFRLIGLPEWGRLAASGKAAEDLGLAAIAFDPARRRLLLHGGGRTIGLLPSYVSNQTWALELVGSPVWHRVAPAFDTPAPGFGRALASDPARRALWVFGGLVAKGGAITYSDELWRADVTAPERWAKLTPTGPAPPGRHEPVGAYDPGMRRVVIFGGWSFDPADDSYHYYDDTWSVTVDSPYVWTRLPGPGEGASAPAGRRGHVGIYNPLRRSLVIFGGFGADSTFGDVWELPLAGGGTWRRLEPLGDGPGARYLANAVYDAPRDRMVLFGGSIGGQSLSDAWALSLGETPRWTRLEPDGNGPGARSYYGVAYDATRGRMLVWGGFDIDFDVIFSSYGVWALSLNGTPHWSFVPQAGIQPYPATGSVATYDPARDRMVTFGGTQVFGDYLTDYRALEFAPGGTARGAWLLGARVERDGVHLLWQTPPGGGGASIRIEKRAEVAAEGVLLGSGARPGGWFGAANVTPDANGLLAWTDPAIGPGGSYRYRLGAQGALGGEVEVVVPGTSRFAIERVAPQPTTGALAITFRSNGLGPVHLALYDVRGRRVATRELGALPEGITVVNYEVPPALRGVCFLRLSQGTWVETRKVVVAR